MTTKWRTIRVFISSTFIDMQEERDELVKVIFPQLRKLCEQRSVTWGEVDLRWGITEEQKAEGKVLPICLAEIHKCRPYFIGLLGERYGWVPQDIFQDLIDRERWLEEHRECSVTELEIVHGVLKNPEMADHAFFYFRNPAYLNNLPAEEEAKYREMATREEIERLGVKGAQCLAAKRSRKLSRLKNLIERHAVEIADFSGDKPQVQRRSSHNGLKVRKNYPSPKAVGALILTDLTELINSLYPEEAVPDSLGREAAGHDAFAESRAKVYIERKKYFDHLDRFAEGSGQPLVILGESGVGKSALLANWAKRYESRWHKTTASQSGSIWKRLVDRFRLPAGDGGHPLLLMHFIGASPQSADWAAMLRRIMVELKRHFRLSQDIPEKPEKLRSEFANWLRRAAAKGRVVLILDGLNQLEDQDNALGLGWLPVEIPANIRLILSTLPGRPLDQLFARGWPNLRVQQLSIDEREQLVSMYLGQYTKALSSEQAKSIARAEQTGNPLYLRTLLEELRLYGDHHTLDERIDFYLAASSIMQLYNKVLHRYEQDFERERPSLVKDTMSFLWAARRGLTEAELLALLGPINEPLPSAQWSPFYLAAEQSLVSRSGLLTFSHDYLRKAVRQRFLVTEEQEQKVHMRLADYFESQELGHRKAEELPWQIAKTREWPRFVKVLCDIDLFPYAMESKREYEWIKYWHLLKDRFDLANCYRDAIEVAKRQKGNYKLIASVLNHASRLLELMGSFESALEFREEAFSLDEVSLGRYNPALAVHLDNLAQLHLRLGNYQKAEELSSHGLSRYKESSETNNYDTALFLINRAVILQETGKAAEAIPLAEKALNIAESVKGSKHPDVALMLDTLSAVYQDAGDIEKAIPLTLRAMEIETTAKGAEHPDVGHCLNSLALLYMGSKKYEKALNYFKRGLSIFEDAFGNDHPNTARMFFDIGRCHQYKGELEQAQRFMQKALPIEEKSMGQTHPHVAYILFCMAYNLIMLGQPAEAGDCCKRALVITQKEFGPDHPRTLMCLERLEAIEGAMG